jgi:predicted acyltransferase
MTDGTERDQMKGQQDEGSAPQPLFVESPIHGDGVATLVGDGGADDATAARRRRKRGRRRGRDQIRGEDATAVTAADPASVDAGVAPPTKSESSVAAPPPSAGSVQSPAPPELTTGRTKRAFSLDALRGLFLLAMTVGFTIRGDFFPLWMYHRQFPPPDYSLVPVAGLGWRDITYVAFLFTMAAALPLTVSRLIDRGESEIGVILKAIRRYGLLLVFALLIGHSNTFFTGYTQTTRAIAILGFFTMALVFTRRREDWNPAVFRTLNVTGWVLAIAFLALSPFAYDSTFSFTRIDDVIAGLAFAALAGSVIWYFTRDNLTARLAVLGAAVALYLGARDAGWVQQWWYRSPIPWALSPSRLSLLCVVIPGTIAGDAILRWSRVRETSAPEADSAAGSAEATPAEWGRPRLIGLALLAASFAPVVLIGLYNRASLPTMQLTAGMLAGGLFLTWRPATPTARVLRSLFMWGAVWLLIGLFMEPFEGGIRKVPETLSYLFTATGLTVMLLVALTAVVDGMGGRKAVSPLIDIGHNPMLAYVLFTVLINSVLEMIEPMRGVLRGSPGEALLRTSIETLAVVLIVMFVTRRRIFWRT